jgi:hypothetical protein
MKTMSVMAQGQKIMKRFEKYLSSRFKNIRINYNSGEIIAERRNFFFGRRYKLRLTVKQVDETITSVEFTVNPHHANPTFSDVERELQLESRLVKYLQ